MMAEQIFISWRKSKEGKENGGKKGADEISWLRLDVDIKCLTGSSDGAATAERRRTSLSRTTRKMQLVSYRNGEFSGSHSHRVQKQGRYAWSLS